MTDTPDTIPAALSTIILLVSERADPNLILTRLRSFVAAEKKAHEKAMADLTRERDEAEQEFEHYLRLAFVDPGANPPISWKSRAERAEADAAETRAILTDVLKRDSELSLSKMDNDCRCITLSRDAEQEYEMGECPHQKARKILTSSTAGRDLLARMERMREALDGINTFAWSAMIADCEETRLECGRRINACRAALADEKEPTP